jgi:hypothetical protein
MAKTCAVSSGDLQDCQVHFKTALSIGDDGKTSSFAWSEGARLAEKLGFNNLVPKLLYFAAMAEKRSMRYT